VYRRAWTCAFLNPAISFLVLGKGLCIKDEGKALYSYVIFKIISFSFFLFTKLDVSSSDI